MMGRLDRFIETRASSLAAACGRFIIDGIVLRLFPRTAAQIALRVFKGGAAAKCLPPEAIHRLRYLLASDVGGMRTDDKQIYLHRQECYAQEGEDLVVARLLGNQPIGFYVDVGAHHPVRHSNTFLLYRLGWSGINVDATPGSMDLFRKIRPRDINIECLVASDSTPREFYILNEPALNTASRDLAAFRSTEDVRYRIVHKATLPTRTLVSILDEYLPSGQVIDLLSVDVEGLDFDVLRSNDWQRYRPKMLLIELLDTTLQDLASHEIALFLRSEGYKPIAKLYNTVVFR